MEPEDSAPLTASGSSRTWKVPPPDPSLLPDSFREVFYVFPSEEGLRASSERPERPERPDSSAGSEPLFPFSGLEVAGPLPFGR
ncbi:unnamed protein product [Arctogadus glacialis]